MQTSFGREQDETCETQDNNIQTTSTKTANAVYTGMQAYRLPTRLPGEDKTKEDRWVEWSS